MTRYLRYGLYLSIVVMAVYAAYLVRSHDLAYEILYDDYLGESIGSGDSGIVIVEIMDYDCPFCREVHPVLAKLHENYPDVKIIYKPVPANGSAIKKPLLVLAAAQLGKFEEAHNFMMNYEGVLDEDGIRNMAVALGVAFDELNKVADSDYTLDFLSENVSAAHRLGVKRTPTFVINGTLYGEYLQVPDYDDFVSIIDQMDAL